MVLHRLTTITLGGNSSECCSVLDDRPWTPGVWEWMRGLVGWGPPPPPSFLRPDDIAELMTGAHAPVSA